MANISFSNSLHIVLKLLAPAEQSVCFDLLASLGDVRDLFDAQSRETLYGFYGEEKGAAFFAEKKAALQSIQKMQKRRLPLKIWVNDAPDDLCGYYWCISMLEYTDRLYKVKFPDSYKIAGDQTPYKITLLDMGLQIPLADLEKRCEKISREEYLYCKREWARLARENSNVRALVNGTLVSVPDDFYDAFLIKCIAGKALSREGLLTEFYRQYPIGVDMVWIDLRIRALAEAGVLQSDADRRLHLRG